jgi:putative membrane protein
MRVEMVRRNKRIGRGLLAGLAGGLMAAWTMNQFQAAYTRAVESPRERNAGERPREEALDSRTEAEAEDATMKAADKLARKLVHRPLSRQAKRRAGPVVHYAFGGAMGALYGATAELFPEVTYGFGTSFGAVLFAVADEVAVPALGLAEGAAAVPISSHLYALVSHLVYGAATEGVRRAALSKV